MANPGNRPQSYKMSGTGYSRLRLSVQQHLRTQSTGVVKSEDTLNKLRRPKPPRTQEHKDNLRKAAKERGFKGPVKDDNWRKAVSKPVLQNNKDGDLIREWDSIQQASDNLKINRSDIGSVCKGRHKTAGGFVWKFKKMDV
jgi:hypothetical protein